MKTQFNKSSEESLLISESDRVMHVSSAFPVGYVFLSVTALTTLDHNNLFIYLTSSLLNYELLEG